MHHIGDHVPPDVSQIQPYCAPSRHVTVMYLIEVQLLNFSRATESYKYNKKAYGQIQHETHGSRPRIINKTA